MDENAPPVSLERTTLLRRIAELEELIALHDLRPVPPTELRVRVGGWDDPDHFLGVGRKIFWDVKRLLRAAGKTLSEFASVLDFGGGCGRLTRHFIPAPGQRIVGCDLDPESIAWCQANLARDGVEFVVNDPAPPLPFAASSFDLAIAISVFSHLPEDLQFAWLDEMARVVRSGGLLLVSVHGDSLLPPETPASTRQALARDGFLYAKGFGTPGLPDFYQTAYHRAEYIRDKWQCGFRLLLELPRGINNHQDAYVLQREGGAP